MKISIVAVGSELLLGQILNTNAKFLSQLFNGVGLNVVEQAVIGDNEARLERLLRQSLEVNDTIVMTGGLGPTKDDLTKHTVAKVLGRELVTDETALEYIESYFKEQKQEMSENNKQQALVIEGATVLPNKVGMAPGMLVEQDGKRIALMPGPPKEMNPMAEEELLPLLMQENGTIFSEQLKFAGIGESRVETELLDLIDNQSNPTIAPLAGSHEVKIRVTASGPDEATCKSLIKPIRTEILNRIGDYYFGSDETTIEQATLEKVPGTFAIYDGVTSGEVYSKLKEDDKVDKLRGMLVDDVIFVEQDLDIKTRLKSGAEQVRKLYQTDIGVALLHEEDEVYLGVRTEDDFKIEAFTMTQKRNLIKHRTPNYVYIRLINMFSK
ncbi:CinA family nicotinamide mononucleotide deamidase-related protein [Staphylococcus simulans]|uniref:Putative competence-damage inducible protein n=2 Tax=Staphylococcus TaxID=1279 RepID=A0A6N3E4P6_STASI|nr:MULTISPECIES: CinA family nicotinamide mononucleotide deamidase-related protein [Staphylococcus]MBO0387313.1 CinA family nicotinamide mononucleotide deamidase-related protein [Staphylococcus simulans]MBU6943454.1 CinA family nicotinamide mononucleotide deamidase-related protein [Staphylococcus sp. CWZ226]MDN6205555.1 CinA family nicotinamide mononucleotide deamidase-related protein [Staphylococcus simulans]MDQ7115413.1 CinA family nicotinamide mononucleotide deamidase-related protein [Staphy